MEFEQYDMFQKIKEKDIPPYVYAYPTRSAQREEKIDINEIWKKEDEYTKEVINLYLHYPFCRYKCGFCNLYSVANNEKDMQDKYIDALCKQIEMYKDIISKRKIKTIFLGGGTPMLISRENITKLVGTLDRLFPSWRKDYEEFCIEASPDSVVEAGEEGIKFLVEKGFTRVNIGIQSFKKKEINNFGRSYEEDVNFKAIQILKNAGVRNISTDLIAGFIGQTKETFLESVRILTSLQPNTISIYHLRIRPDSKFGKEEQYNKKPNIIFYEWYEEARKIIIENGFKQDTNVRFIREDGGYIQQDYQFNSYPVLGIGAGARSYTSSADYIIGGSSRPDIYQITDYIEGVENNTLKTERVYHLNDEERVRRRLVLNLYKFDTNELHDIYGDKYDYIFKDILPKLIEKGMVSQKDGIYTLTKEGYKYRDIISWGFFSKEVQMRDKQFYSKLEEENKKERGEC